MARLTLKGLQAQASEFGLVLGKISESRYSYYVLRKGSKEISKKLLTEVAEELKYYEENGCFSNETFKLAYDCQSFEDVEKIATETDYTLDQISIAIANYDRNEWGKLASNYDNSREAKWIADNQQYIKEALTIWDSFKDSSYGDGFEKCLNYVNNPYSDGYNNLEGLPSRRILSLFKFVAGLELQKETEISEVHIKTEVAAIASEPEIKTEEISRELVTVKVKTDLNSEVAEQKAEMQLSAYQQSILDWAINEEGNGCVNAVAGSGKSTTLKLVAKALQNAGMNPSDVRIIVFGKANASDLIAKFGEEWKGSISTLHSAGLQLLRDELRKKPDISESKYKWIAQDLGYMSKYDKRSKQWVTGALTEDTLIKNEADFIKLFNLTRLTNQYPDQEVIEKLSSHFEVEDVFNSSAVASAIADCLEEGERRARQRFSIDYTDMIWLPVKWQLKVKPFKFVLVDECQDLNRAQLELSLMLAGKFGRILAVGDRKQAIMGFSGSDCNSFQNIVDRTKAKELPLSICYRCPKSHIDLVNQIFPEIPIESAPNAKEGKIHQIKEIELDKQLQVGDLVLSRKTAPLVKICIQLIAKGIPATVKGKDIGASLKKEIEEISKIKSFEYERFTDFVSLYKDAKFERLEKLDNAESMIQNLNDKLTAIETIYISYIEAKNVKDLCNYIDNLFSDNESPITLSTAHRAKGLENDRIFLINPNDMPMVWKGQSAWQYEQEENLLYVSLTRSKSELFIVGNPHWLIEEDKTEKKPEVTEVKPVEVKPELKPAPIVLWQRLRLRNQTEVIVNEILITPYQESVKQDSDIQETGLVSRNGYPITIEDNQAVVKNKSGKVVKTYDLESFNSLKHKLQTVEEYEQQQVKTEVKPEKVKKERKKADKVEGIGIKGQKLKSDMNHGVKGEKRERLLSFLQQPRTKAEICEYMGFSPKTAQNHFTYIKWWGFNLIKENNAYLISQ